jgi:hypothetical protein
VQNAELNPLLNPLLADNMGKWAEVYFTNPPERRDQAVLQLLRELEAQNPDRQRVATAKPATQPETESVHCQKCGRDNPITHRFCGPQIPLGKKGPHRLNIMKKQAKRIEPLKRSSRLTSLHRRIRYRCSGASRKRTTTKKNGTKRLAPPIRIAFTWVQC